MNDVCRRQRDPDQVLVRRHVRHGAPEPAAAARLPALHERRALAAQPQRDARHAHSRRAPAAADRRHRPGRTAAAVLAAAAAARGRHRRVARHAGAAACVTRADVRRAVAANVLLSSCVSSLPLYYTAAAATRTADTIYFSLDYSRSRMHMFTFSARLLPLAR